MPPSERAFRTQAIILKRRDLGEADRLLTVLTPSYGKLDVMAKGARKPTSSKTGHVELYTRADMLIHSGRNWGILRQVEMQEPHLGIREDLHRGAYANYIVELLDRFIVTDDEDTPDALFHLLDDTLGRLGVDEDPRLAVRYFEMRLLDNVGFRPELNECVIGREPIRPEDQFFSYAEGGVVCPNDAKRITDARALTPVSVLTLKLMRHMQRSKYSHVKSLQMDDRVHANLERVMLGYLTYLLERRLQSVDFIRRLRRQTST